MSEPRATPYERVLLAILRERDRRPDNRYAQRTLRAIAEELGVTDDHVAAVRRFDYEGDGPWVREAADALAILVTSLHPPAAP